MKFNHAMSLLEYTAAIVIEGKRNVNNKQYLSRKKIYIRCSILNNYRIILSHIKDALNIYKFIW